MNKRHKFLVMVIMIGLMVASSVYLWQNLVFMGETRNLNGTPHRLLIQNGVSEQTVALINEAITLADDYFITTFGTTVSTPMEIRLAQSTPCVPFESLNSGRTAIVTGDTMCVNTIGNVWRSVISGNQQLGSYIIAHEYFHLLQEEQGCLPDPGNHEYAWWVEGSATYVGWQTLLLANKATEEDVEVALQSWGSFSNQLQPLIEYETSISGDAAYGLAYGAVDDLVQRAGTVASLYQFCELISESDDWHAVFENVYGISPQNFYTEFAQ